MAPHGTFFSLSVVYPRSIEGLSKVETRTLFPGMALMDRYVGAVVRHARLDYVR